MSLLLRDKLARFNPNPKAKQEALKYTISINPAHVDEKKLNYNGVYNDFDELMKGYLKTWDSFMEVMGEKKDGEIPPAFKAKPVDFTLNLSGVSNRYKRKMNAGLKKIMKERLDAPFRVQITNKKGGIKNPDSRFLIRNNTDREITI